MAHIEDVLLEAIAQKGDKYVFGAEANASNPNPDKFDCSELVEWACARASVQPKVPDGAFNQWSSCKQHGTMLSVDDGIKTRGALLFVGDGTGSGRDAITHVAFSLGDGTTIEARGSKWGVGCWTSLNRFNFAGRIPGVDYSAGHGTLGPIPGPVIPPFPGLVKLGSKGDGVRQVQQRLKDRGWKSVSVTGDFDQHTDEIVRKFQGEKHLEVDGKVGTNTWNALWTSPVT